MIQLAHNHGYRTFDPLRKVMCDNAVLQLKLETQKC